MSTDFFVQVRLKLHRSPSEDMVLTTMPEENIGEGHNSLAATVTAQLSFRGCYFTPSTRLSFQDPSIVAPAFWLLCKKRWIDLIWLYRNTFFGRLHQCRMAVWITCLQPGHVMWKDSLPSNWHGWNRFDSFWLTETIDRQRNKGNRSSRRSPPTRSSGKTHPTV